MLIQNPTLNGNPLLVIILVHVTVRQFREDVVLERLVLLPLQNFSQLLIRLMKLFGDEEAFVFLLLRKSSLAAFSRELKVVTLHQRIFLIENRQICVSLRNV